MIIDIPTRHAILMDFGLRLWEVDDDFPCEHAPEARWPFKKDWEICADCGEIVRPDDFIPVFPSDLMSYHSSLQY